MSKISAGVLAVQALATPVIASSLALLSWFICSRGGLFGLVLPWMWLVGFFVLGLEAHGLFYLCALPIPDEHDERSGALRFVQAFWFLQVPFSMFNGLRPPTSILVTQGLMAVVALAFVLWINRSDRIVARRRELTMHEPPRGRHR